LEYYENVLMLLKRLMGVKELFKKD